MLLGFEALATSTARNDGLSLPCSSVELFSSLLRCHLRIFLWQFNFNSLQAYIVVSFTKYLEIRVTVTVGGEMTRKVIDAAMEEL